MYSNDLFEGYTALVTGAGQGIGHEIAVSLARFGADVAVNDIDGQKAEETAREIENGGRNSIALQGDVSSPQDVETMVRDATETLGSIQLLVNNAGTNSGGTLAELDVDDWDRVMDINTKGTYLVSKAVASSLLETDTPGSIVNMSSIAGVRPNTDFGAYSASKAAIIKMTEQMALELATDEIRVNCICPGLIWTEASDAVYSDEQLLEQRREWTPTRRIGTPEDVANAAVFLLAPANDYVTGETVFVDGAAQCVGLNLMPGRSQHPH